jgi:amidophosphoribosyltransferase
MVAHNRSVDEVRDLLGADSLHYLSLEGVYDAVQGQRATHCDACFSGEYPLAGTEDAGDKHSLEPVPLPLVASAVPR